MLKSYRVGRVFGIPIEFDITFLFILPIFAWLIGNQIEQLVPLLNDTLNAKIAVETLTSGARPWLIGLIVAVGLFIGVVLHELGHSLVALYYGYEIESITLWLLGGMANFTETPRNWRHEFAIAIAGPIVSVAIGIICYYALFDVPSGLDVIEFILAYLAVLNIAIAGFNLLPAFPLDGGRVLRALLARSQPYVRATRQAATIGKVFAVIIGLSGLYMSNLFWVAIAFFIYIAAAAESQQMMLDAAFEGISVRDIMTPATELSNVPPDLPVDRLLDRMFRERHTGFPVVDENRRLLGIVTLSDVHNIESDDRLSTVVADVMTPVDEITIVSPNSEVTEALREFRHNPVGRLLVVDEGGNLSGIITRTDVMTALEIAQAEQRIEDRLPTSG
ncbi:metalloprotease [halophilic archaeon]|nr:metalloprotease [halophilic archaeon]